MIVHLATRPTYSCVLLALGGDVLRPLFGGTLAANIILYFTLSKYIHRTAVTFHHAHTCSRVQLQCTKIHLLDAHILYCIDYISVAGLA